ncbi:protease inhibitor I42 family protein [Uliginosibacterium sp. sgz301328]|uniref:protease inhibitor I42 family protein n=1 Tax=Uliginosibacterium sp. sgz301328 TaxID=3243764 RepID=UPI00359E8760
MRAALAALLCALLGACSTLMPQSTQRANVSLTDADSGTDRFVKAGDIIEISLPASRTTGFAWGFVADAATTVVSLGQPQYVQDAGSGVGRGGVEKWRFRANRAGTQTLRFEYRRPADRATPPSRTASFNIRVN